MLYDTFHLRIELARKTLERNQPIAEIYLFVVEKNLNDGLGSTGILNDLLGKVDVLGGLRIPFLGILHLGSPFEQEDEAKDRTKNNKTTILIIIILIINSLIIRKRKSKFIGILITSYKLMLQMNRSRSYP